MSTNKPSPEAMEAAHTIYGVDGDGYPYVHKIEEYAALLDAFAAKRVAEAVANERAAILRIVQTAQGSIGRDVGRERGARRGFSAEVWAQLQLLQDDIVARGK